MATTQLRGTDVYDGSVCRVDLNVLDSGKAVIRKIAVGSGISMTNNATGADPGTGDVVVSLDFTTLDTRWATSLWAKNALKPAYTTSEIPEAATPVNMYFTTARVDGNAKVITAYNHSQAAHAPSNAITFASVITAFVTGANSTVLNTDSLEIAIEKLQGQVNVRTSNTGTVTSVGMTVPTGLSVSGTPITGSGTLSIALVMGYAIPTTANVNTWNGLVSFPGFGTTVSTAANGNHTHAYLPLAGGTLTGPLNGTIATFSDSVVVTGTENREVSTYIASSYTTNDLVSGHSYKWYADIWRVGATRGSSAGVADYIIALNGVRKMALSVGGAATFTGGRLLVNNSTEGEGFSVRVNSIGRFELDTASDGSWSLWDNVSGWHKGIEQSGGSITVGGSISSNNHINAVGHIQSGDYVGAPGGLSLYSSTTNFSGTYGISFTPTATASYGTHGAVTGDWATYFNMSDTAVRGWIFRNEGSGGVASISNKGTATFSGDVIVKPTTGYKRFINSNPDGSLQSLIDYNSITIIGGNLSVNAPSTIFSGIVLSTGVQVGGHGAVNDPYGTISVTQPNSSNYSYYGMTRAGVLGIGMGITTLNEFFIGDVTATTGVLSNYWLKIKGETSAEFKGIVIAKSLQVGQQTNGTTVINAHDSFAYFGCNTDTNGLKVGPDGVTTFSAAINVKNSNTAIDSDGSNLYFKSAGVVYLNSACNSYVNNNGSMGNAWGNSTQWQEGYANSRKFTLSTFSYDTSMHFYWNKIARIEAGYNHLNINVLVQQNMDSAASMGIFNINISRSGAGRIRVTNAPLVFDPWGGNSDVACCVDSNYDIWIKSDVSWAPSLKYIILDNIGCTIYEGSAMTAQEAQPFADVVSPNETKSWNTAHVLEGTNIFGLATYGANFGLGLRVANEKLHVGGNIKSDGNIIASGDYSGNYISIIKNSTGLVGNFSAHSNYVGEGTEDYIQVGYAQTRLGMHYSGSGSWGFVSLGGTQAIKVYANGNVTVTGSMTANGGGFNSGRNIKNIHKDWGGNALNVISKFKIRDFNYKTRPDYDRTLGFIIDEIPKEISDYALSGEERNAVNTYTLHGLSFKGLQEVKTKLDVQEGELDWQSAKIILLEKKIMELEGRLN